ncbi:MAG TPA: Cof-type HAD-IIB family hydrolase [Candidatus Blautia intestinipullorum]|nr:Cof-type HAD-IIB family hydrolase [Candidatus Blautia intestinipullorum]
MVPKLITIDLDGTLLRNDCTIAPTVRKAILTCLNTSKTFFVPCTGRSYQNSRFVLGDFPAFPYYINANGTTVTEGSSGTLLHASTLPLETGCAVYSLAREYKTFIEIYHGLTAYDGAAGRQNLKESSCSKDYISQLLYTNTHLESLDDFVFDKKHPISKFHIVCVSQREKQELKQRLSRIPGVFPISTTDFNIEICREGWSKREGLIRLCQILHISPEETAAIGDSENDYEMLQWAGCGIAMGNAAPEIKKAADYITGSNEEEGIIHALKYLGLL